MNISDIAFIAKVILSVSLFFIWVVRYQNIVAEFKHYGLPDKLRDFVGITKLSIAVLIHHPNPTVVATASSALIFLMACALITHLKVRNSYSKMLPAVSIVGLVVVVLMSL